MKRLPAWAGAPGAEGLAGCPVPRRRKQTEKESNGSMNLTWHHPLLTGGRLPGPSGLPLRWEGTDLRRTRKPGQARLWPGRGASPAKGPWGIGSGRQALAGKGGVLVTSSHPGIMRAWRRPGGSESPLALRCRKGILARAPHPERPSGAAQRGCVPAPWALDAPMTRIQRRRSPCPHVCMCGFVSFSVFVFFSYVWVFSWSCFIGIRVIKTWCSLGALTWRRVG